MNLDQLRYRNTGNAAPVAMLATAGRYVTQPTTQTPESDMAKASLAKRQQRVREAWERIEGAEPDISTERLLAMVADDTDEDYGDVAALHDGENPDDL